MILTEEQATTRYRVEVSGWDAHKAFFVENSDLDWSGQADKRVTLSRGLPEGAVIFLRLLQPLTSERPHPVPYEAELVAKTEEGLRQFRLRPISSRAERNPALF